MLGNALKSFLVCLRTLIIHINIIAKMTKFPFTNEGVEQLFATLYQLSDDLLQEEINLLQQDFKGWMAYHFFLNEEQLRYLNNLPETFEQSAAALIGLAMRNQLPVILNKQTNGEVSLRKGKLVDTKNNIVTQYEEGDGPSAHGELLFTIHY